jgi:hypothetical protein
MKPKPRERPVSRSVTTCASVTSPRWRMPGADVRGGVKREIADVEAIAHLLFSRS